MDSRLLLDYLLQMFSFGLQEEDNN